MCKRRRDDEMCKRRRDDERGKRRRRRTWRQCVTDRPPHSRFYQKNQFNRILVSEEYVENS